MQKKSYSKQIVESQVMLDGVTVHKEKLANRGVDDEYIDSYKSLLDRCINLNNSQEQAKANMKNLTVELREAMEQLSNEYQFCKRGVIINIPKALWNAFGFIYRPRGPKSQEEPENPPDDSTDEPPEETLNAATDNAIGYVNTVKPANVQPKKSRKNRKRSKKRR